MTLDERLRELLRDELKPIHDELRRIAAEKSGRRTEYLTVAEAATLANLHDSTIRGWIASGRLRASDKPIRIRPEDLDAAMTSPRRTSAVDPPDKQAIAILRRVATRSK